MSKSNKTFDGQEGDLNITQARQKWREKQIDSTSSKILNEDEKYFFHQSLSTPCLTVLSECDGIYLKDLNDKKYIDLHGNNVHQIGFRNQFVINRIKEQLDTLPFSTRRYTNLPAIELARKLTSLAPGNLNKVLFTPGGTSANGLALKIARLVTGKFKTISMWDSFHGASLDAISVGGESLFRKNIGPLLTGTEHVPPPTNYRGLWSDEENEDHMKYADYIEYVIKKEGDIGAIIAETVRNTDVQIPSKSYWKRVREICDEHGVLLILDEIPICFGRTGKMFAFEHYDIVPDMVTIGKVLGGGIIPIAAVIGKDGFDISPEKSLGHYTFEKSPLGSVAGLATIEYIEKNNLLARANVLGQQMKEELQKLQDKYQIIGNVRGIGLLWGIDLVKDRKTKERATKEAEKIMYQCLENGLSFKVAQGNVINLSPPLTITDEELKQVFNIIDNAIETITKNN